MKLKSYARNWAHATVLTRFKRSGRCYAWVKLPFLILENGDIMYPQYGEEFFRVCIETPCPKLE